MATLAAVISASATTASSSIKPTYCFLRKSWESKTAKGKEVRVIGNFSHFGETVHKDFEFIKKGVRLTGMDLFMADLKALEAYASYFYYLSKLWSKPLPEVYDPQDVADYFSCRPHVVALRLLEVFSAFASATIRIRASGMRKFLQPNSDRDVNGNISQYNFGVVLKETMLNLGPTFIKVGQSLSTRPDIIGTEISKALSELHDQIPPFPRTMAMKIVEEELGSPVESFFSCISEEPVAAASFGQVYRANTLDGCNVALKVQRPNLRHVVVRDIYILRLGLGLVQKIAKRKNDLRLYADELGKGLVGELDYSLEAANASKFQDIHSSFKFMHVPKIYHHLTRKRVLTMEWVVGESPTDLLSISAGNAVDHGYAYSERQKTEAKRRLLDLVSKGVEASLVQLLETGLLHADPHPGNLRYTSSGQLGFLDFGLLCQMEKKHQFAMLASIVHIVNGDWESLVRALIEMDIVRPGTNLRRVTMELENSLGEVEFRDGIPDVKFSRVLSKIWSVALKYHFRMPPYYTLVLRSLASLEGLAVAADPNFKTFEAAYPYVVRKLLTENSNETRRILHSVVLNKRKEFRWDRLALFLRVGSTRKVLNRAIAPKSESSFDYLTNRSSGGVFDVAHLVLLLLPSRDGIALRKLLMTADGASLVRAVVSKEAVFFRQQLSRVIADLLYQWVVKTLGIGNKATKYSSQVRLTSELDNKELGPSSNLSMSMYDYQSIFQDRRLKVIFSRILNSAMKNPVLMLKLCWTSVVMVVAASALACHRVLVSLSEIYIAPFSLARKEVALSA
ncbi:Ubiquinone biosynthesis protein coq-8, putative [Ricinus communis]|uniref:Ubiquinone biosynthesis protein coq-8, putative n=1 Tax=Ricinus communis TaxID=3988 RepID=B9T4T1_RICCO|nr:Ubiquinone biosynthesis protein coq-8, putative [Ricinus communis]